MKVHSSSLALTDSTLFLAGALPARRHILQHTFCTVCDTSGARLNGSPSTTILVVDTNFVLHQIDLLENQAFDNIVVLSIVLEEVKNKNMAVYNRIRALCSNATKKLYVFSNEYHSGNAAIRVATQWYQNHLGGAVKVLLITNDRENKRKASEEGIFAETGSYISWHLKFESYVKSLDQPDLLDLLVRPASEDVNMEDVEDLKPSKRKVIYSEHKPMSEITSGLHRGIYHQGKLRVNRCRETPFNSVFARCNTDKNLTIWELNSIKIISTTGGNLIQTWIKANLGKLNSDMLLQNIMNRELFHVKSVEENTKSDELFPQAMDTSFSCLRSVDEVQQCHWQQQHALSMAKREDTFQQLMQITLSSIEQSEARNKRLEMQIRH
ncbi:hypothetical protein V8G54_014907 [Vigna mungo]|uniref:PIN domain-containing protein n=1 Tax=Vigna mungo TaxID=3915 RepID=A0AAQ3NJ29_VIGMU